MQARAAARASAAAPGDEAVRPEWASPARRARNARAQAPGPRAWRTSLLAGLTADGRAVSHRA
ncbi:hypothetical protein GCM10020221_09280 [Streptomyces thioluteus]|uniref:Uncharacterized protein n=1 Tax=Streptomyces thioluteus TaxID=66431 RepID=A0ABN3WJ99_STRTU